MAHILNLPPATRRVRTAHEQRVRRHRELQAQRDQAMAREALHLVHAARSAPYRTPDGRLQIGPMDV